MPAIFKIRPRMRTLLSPAVIKIELVGILAWLGALFIDSVSALNVIHLLITLCLLSVWYVHRVIRSFLMWRVMGGLYIFVLSVGFAYIIRSHMELRIFALPLAVIIVLSSAILFITVSDYLLSSVQVWLLMWTHIDIDIYRGQELYLLLFCLSSVSIGFTLSFTYLRNLRSVLLVESEIRTLAETDFLTSLLNRRAFMELFQKLLADGRYGYFIMLDIDGFKLKNDQYGHDVGDKILCAMANCLKSTPGSYCVGRIGGEEFGVLVLGDDDLVVQEYALRLLGAIRASVAPPHHYTCSAGIARFSENSDMSAVLKCADKNMYRAKHNGKDRVFQDGEQVGALMLPLFAQ